LRDIQVELAPDREPAPVLDDEPQPAAPRAEAPDPGTAPRVAAPAASEPQVPPTPQTPPTPHVPQTPPIPHVPQTPQAQAVSELSARLLASTRELLAGYEQVLVGATASEPTRRAVRRAPDSRDVTLSAAPFVNLQALHAFEQAVSGLPGVRDVVIRGYEGTDRAIIEVRLDGRSP
ncbi:MAG: hypothetical protein JO130_13670, partial [Solirubrobacterales bacterium]|nr:hypothetical protein [Solirubrobacterales bacterium]